MNRPKSVQLKIYIPRRRTIFETSLFIICPKYEGSDKPQCTVKLLRLNNGKQSNVDHTRISNTTEFNLVQQNPVQIDFTNIEPQVKTKHEMQI
ncbi:hypothetical protein D915_010543 [Fasciola hepatica]|uniref:Uncharacterized protein n=1 Tax=Fasciola hepatica TaxID=6192 RepID=A0A4E0QUC3_FASHE|nr:hypothetical protein D915_010543 [Fasciola hepatica]